ncbi:MAG: hypothetical protein JO037_09975 [Actinobacteria bacterium]|nr:hypothetical protein [Actinomycetota bacterium]
MPGHGGGIKATAGRRETVAARYGEEKPAIAADARNTSVRAVQAGRIPAKAVPHR